GYIGDEEGVFLVCFFFFQAEDGIRDGHVTGVQTCALPIFGGSASAIAFPTSRFRARQRCGTSWPLTTRKLPGSTTSWASCSPPRSEERRVGKECRCRRCLWNVKKKGDTQTKK